MCAGPEFTLDAEGRLAPSRAGVFRRVARTYADAAFDGAFGPTPSPGRNHLDLELAWVNDTGMPQYVLAEVERGPWLIVIANTNEGWLRERLTTAVGVGARAADPDTSTTTTGQFSGHVYAPAQPFLPPTVPEQAVTSYTALDRGVSRLAGGLTAAGETFSARYRATFHTKAPLRTVLGPENYEARARHAWLRLHAAPARGA